MDKPKISAVMVLAGERIRHRQMVDDNGKEPP
jgi:hypothetical protein